MVPEESGCSGWNRISEQNPAFRHAHSPLRHAIVAPCQRKPLCMAKNRDREDHRLGRAISDLPKRCPTPSSRRPRRRLGETPPAVFPRPGRWAPADALHDRHFWPARADFADTRRPLPLWTVYADVGPARVGARFGAGARPEGSVRPGGTLPQRGTESLRPPRPLRCRFWPASRHRVPTRSVRSAPAAGFRLSASGLTCPGTP